jgi:hypothetical protein
VETREWAWMLVGRLVLWFSLIYHSGLYGMFDVAFQGDEIISLDMSNRRF